MTTSMRIPGACPLGAPVKPGPGVVVLVRERAADQGTSASEIPVAGRLCRLLRRRSALGSRRMLTHQYEGSYRRARRRRLPVGPCDDPELCFEPIATEPRVADDILVTVEETAALISSGRAITS